MITFNPETLERLRAGEVDYVDALSLVFDSGVANFALGLQGHFTWPNDPVLGTQTFHGMGVLASLDVPEDALGPEAKAITGRLAETYLPDGSDVPVNVFSDEMRATIDDEEWEGRPAILSVFWRAKDGTVLERQQVALRSIDAMYVETDAAGNPMRVAVLEEPDILQRDVEGKTANAESQALIDPTDKSFEHVGTVTQQTITFGRAEEKVEGNDWWPFW